MSEDMNIFGAPNDDEAEDIVLNLSGDDLQDGSFKDIPDGTWVRVSIYDAQLGKVQKEGDNKGKPQAIFTFKLVGESAKVGDVLRVEVDRGGGDAFIGLHVRHG